MNTVYHCGNHPEVVCETASHGAVEAPCATCLYGENVNEKKSSLLTRNEVVAIAEKDAEYGHCGTCRHYQHLFICGACHNGARYSFDWRRYAEEKRLF